MRQSVIENSIGYRPVCAAGGLKIGRVVEMSSLVGSGPTEIDSAAASTALIPLQNYPKYRFFRCALKKSAFSGSPVARVIRSGVDQREPWLQILSERH